MRIEQEPARSLWLVVAILGLIAVAVVLVTAPLERLMGSGVHAVRGAVHGTVAALFMVTSTIGLFQACLAAGHASLGPLLKSR